MARALLVATLLATAAEAMVGSCPAMMTVRKAVGLSVEGVESTQRSRQRMLRLPHAQSQQVSMSRLEPVQRLERASWSALTSTTPDHARRSYCRRLQPSSAPNSRHNSSLCSVLIMPMSRLEPVQRLELSWP